MPGNLYKTFYVKFVKRAVSDPLPSQDLTNIRPAFILTPLAENSNQNEYEIKAIFAAKNARKAEGKR